MVEGAFQTYDERDVVGGVGALELVEEPEPALGVGQGDDVRAREPGEGRLGVLGEVEPLSEQRGAGGLEEGADGDFDAGLGTDAADEAGGEEGVPAEFEEVVVNADPLDPEYFREECAERGFQQSAGSAAAGVGLVRGRGRPRPWRTR